MRGRTMCVAGMAILSLSAALYLFPATATAGTFSRDKTRAIVKQAAHHYGFGPVKTRRLQRWAIDIIYGPGAHESSGSTRCKTGDCWGIMQFDPSWHMNCTEKRLKKRLHFRGDWRLSGRVSLWRYVRVYRDGGYAKIHQHWAATLGR